MAAARTASRGRKSRARGAAGLLVLTTAPDRASAERIGHALVSERLAACVNVIPGLTSLYRWKGKIEQDRELLCLIKTRKPLLSKLVQRLTALHPYDVPEVIALPIAAGSRPYMDWLLEQTT